MRRVATRLQCISSSKNRNDACTKILIKASFSVIKRDFFKNRGVVCCWLDGCGMRGVTLAWKKRERDRETEKRRKNPVKSHSEQKTAQFSCLCCEFCRLGWKTSSTVRVDISATPPLSERLTAQTSSQLRSRSTTLLFLFLFGNLKKRKEIHIHAPICAQCTARRPATVKSVYLNERKVGLSEFIVVFFLFFFFHTQR